MTYEAFLKRLGLTTGWSIQTVCGSPWLRRGSMTECPLAVVAGAATVQEAFDAGFRISDGADIGAIMRAADGRERHDPAIRHDLLVACGLQRTEQQG